MGSCAAGPLRHRWTHLLIARGDDFRAKAPIDLRIGRTSTVQSNLCIFFFLLDRKKHTSLSKPVFAMATRPADVFFAVDLVLAQKGKLVWLHANSGSISDSKLQAPGVFVPPQHVVTRFSIVVATLQNDTKRCSFFLFTFGSFSTSFSSTYTQQQNWENYTWL